MITDEECIKAEDELIEEMEHGKRSTQEQEEAMGGFELPYSAEHDNEK